MPASGPPGWRDDCSPQHVKQRIITVSNRLPVTVGEQIKPSSGGLVAALSGLSSEEYELRWIGWPGAYIEDEQRRREVEQILQDQYHSACIFLSQEQVTHFYEGFSNSSLWPLLHYMPSRFRYEPEWWRQYESVNRLFAERTLQEARDGDLVWVHDYQLMLVPAMLRQANPSLRVGFFLHTPFPSFDVFRCQPRREELVRGLLGANLIGFHTFGYLRHFRDAVQRLLGVESEIMSIRYEGHCAQLGIYPIGISARRFKEELGSAPFAEQVRLASAAHTGKKVVLSVERLDYTKGLVERLNAIDQFLGGVKDRDAIKFILISIPSRENVDEYRALREEVEGMVGRINGKYATLLQSPIRFIHGSVSFTELCALYAIADICMVTPLVDGMNLVAKEYVACQGDHAGVLILSEFAGAAEELHSAILVNPYDAESLVNALHRGLEMSEHERRRRMALMRHRVLTADAQSWARSFIDDLNAARPAETHSGDVGLARQKLTSALADGRSIAFFLDYDGTLRELVPDPGAATPTPAVRELLSRLASIHNASTTIISGRRAEELEDWFAEYPFGLIAEHGTTIRRPGQSWEQLGHIASMEWKEPVLRVLQLYERAAPGSFIEEKRTSLVWHYRRADPDFGPWKAAQLVNELSVLTANFPIKVRHGRKIVEISPMEISKASAVSRVAAESSADLVLIAGDDETDEDMFTLGADHVMTIKVGGGQTRAQLRLPTPAALRQFLHNVLPRDLAPSGPTP